MGDRLGTDGDYITHFSHGLTGQMFKNHHLKNCERQWVGIAI